MYICRNCGLKYIADDAVMCVRCQAPKGAGNQFCPYCGTQAAPEQKVCRNCGVDMERYGALTGGKSKVAAGLLGIFLGCYGIHNFYLGYKKKGFIQLGIVVLAFFLWIAAYVPMAIWGVNHVNTAGMMIFFLLFFVGIVGVEIWGFVEGILILCGKIDRDGNGRLLQ